MKRSFIGMMENMEFTNSCTDKLKLQYDRIEFNLKAEINNFVEYFDDLLKHGEINKVEHTKLINQFKREVKAKLKDIISTI